MKRRAIVLASSPVVGPLAMARLAEAFGGIGVDARTAAAPFDIDEYVQAVAEACPDGPHVVAGYSAAGPRLAAVAAVTNPLALVFLDARLPVDGVAPIAEAAFADLLARLPVDADGMLPPWPAWWPADTLAALCPDAALRARFVDECPPVPRSMYDRPIPAPGFDGPCAFVAFGDGYADQRELAESRGWPTARLEQRHLAPLVAPGEVATAVVDVVERMGVW